MSSVEPIFLRNYQRELVQVALTGKNVVVCAPTNSGKTIVAAYIIKNHIEKCLLEHRDYKVCFFVPTTSILTQQYNVIRRYMDYRIIKISGDINVPLRESIETHDIIIITPQMILNLLTKKSGNEKECWAYPKFSVSAFSLMIFDEAHHTAECYPYNKIMDHYLDTKLLSFEDEKILLPQIIGLTASLGVGKAKYIADAINHLAKKCANLDSRHIACVESEENKRELEEYVARARDHIKLCTQSYKNSIYYEEFNTLINYYEKIIFGIPEAVDSTINDLLNENKSTIDDYNSYRNWVYNLEKKICENKNGHISKNSHQKILASLDKLKHIHKAIEFLRLFNSTITLKYLSETVQLRNISGNDRVLENSLLRLENSDRIYPFCSDILTNLLEILRQHFLSSTWNPFEPSDGRVIIFINCRDYAMKLANVINEKFPNIQADYLTGVSKSSEQGGITQESQRKKLHDFNNGTFRVLCSTSVSEEGLDIPRCNLVLKYSYVTNEIANIQRRGRGRDKQSKSILITDDNFEIRKERMNITGELLMDNALAHIKNMPTNEFISMINEETVKLVKQRQIEKESEKLKHEENRRKVSAVMFRILCKTCKNVISNSMWLRKAETNFVIVDPNFWKKVRTKEISEDPQNIRMDTKCTKDIGSHWCNQHLADGKICGNQLGRIFYWNKVYLPSFSCSSLIFEKNFRDQIVSITSKQWKKIMENHFGGFEPTEITRLELAQMNQEYSNRK